MAVSPYHAYLVSPVIPNTANTVPTDSWRHLYAVAYTSHNLRPYLVSLQWHLNKRVFPAPLPLFGSPMIEDPENTAELSGEPQNFVHFPSDKIGPWLSAILASSMDGVIVIDADRNILLVNRETERMFAHNAATLTQYTLDYLLPSRLHEENRLQIQGLAATKVDGRRLRIKLDLVGVRSTGEEFLIDASISRVAVDGKLYFAIILRELTPQHDIHLSLSRGNKRLRKLAVSSQQKNEVEKKNFSRELYDDLGQRLSVLKLDLDWLHENVRNTEAAIHDRVEQMQRLLESAIARTKSIASTLRPPLLDDFGLVAAIEWMASNFQKRTGIRCNVENPSATVQCGDPADSAVFRIIQESLLNIERHAHASNVHIKLEHDGKWLNIVIQDDGIGLAPGDEDKPGCYGLLAMQERVYILGGTISRNNIKPAGFAIHASIPVDQSSNQSSSI